MGRYIGTTLYEKRSIRTLAWNKYIGADNANANAKCISCKEERIDCRNFHCGHVLSESKGGDLTIANLRPICSHLSMGTRSMNEFTLEFFGRQFVHAQIKDY